MYVGPTERLPPNHCWVLDPTPAPPPSPTLNNVDSITTTATSNTTEQESSTTTRYRMVHKEYGIIPALIKIFDEILVNATDNLLRHPESCTKLHVTIHPGGGETNSSSARTEQQPPQPPMIRIWNNGKGIPIQIHKDEQMYVPEMLFGHLLTGSNFDDNEKRLTGGRHGYGAKLTNIFSKQFVVETYDKTQNLYYKQIWTNNMKIKHEPQIIFSKQFIVETYDKKQNLYYKQMWTNNMKTNMNHK